MKKRVKYGLIAGAVACAAIVAGFVRRDSGRIPTLPTPPGVVVPEGMRYVGGDEFDGPDGSVPDTAKWKIEAVSYYMWRRNHPDSEPLRQDEVIVKDGILSISPGGSQGYRNVNITHLANPVGKRAGIIEIRARIAPPRSYNGSNGTTLFIRDDEGHLGRLAGYWTQEPAEFSADDKGPDGKGVFHVYRMEWRDGVFHRFKDNRELPSDGSMMVEDDFTMESLSSGLPSWLESRLPDSVIEALNPVVNAFERRRHHLEADVYADSPKDRPALEIDYVRVFQE